MSSDSENSDSSTSSTQYSHSSETGEDYHVFNSQYAPYEDEPLAPLDDDINEQEENIDVEESDIDNLTPAI